jgi:hypothetical protein
MDIRRRDKFMRLSALQKHIIFECGGNKGARIKRNILASFYDKQKKKPNQELMVKIITQSIERLIRRDLIVGFGEITKHKIFIKEIKLTAKGKKEAKRLLGEQRKLPLR